MWKKLKYLSPWIGKILTLTSKRLNYCWKQTNPRRCKFLLNEWLDNTSRWRWSRTRVWRAWRWRSAISSGLIQNCRGSPFRSSYLRRTRLSLTTTFRTDVSSTCPFGQLGQELGGRFSNFVLWNKLSIFNIQVLFNKLWSPAYKILLFIVYPYKRPLHSKNTYIRAAILHNF